MIFDISSPPLSFFFFFYSFSWKVNTCLGLFWVLSARIATSRDQRKRTGPLFFSRQVALVWLVSRLRAWEGLPAGEVAILGPWIAIGPQTSMLAIIPRQAWAPCHCRMSRSQWRGLGRRKIFPSPSLPSFFCPGGGHTYSGLVGFPETECY